MYKNHHSHDQVTGGTTTHHHSHKPTPLYPQVQVTPSYNPHVEVQTRTRAYNSYTHTHDHSYYGAGRGRRVLLVGTAVFLPILLIAAILSLTLNTVVTTASVTTAGAVAAGTASAIAFSAATFGIGALLLYGAVGLAYLYSSAKECYNSDKNVFNMIKSRVLNEDGASFKGIMKSIGAVLWSPFLLIGGLAGMGVKAAVNACTSKSPALKKEEPELQITGSPYSKMTSDPSKKSGNGLRKDDKEPVHFDSVFTDTQEVTEKDTHLLSSNNSFTPLYPTSF